MNTDKLTKTQAVTFAAFWAVKGDALERHQVVAGAIVTIEDVDTKLNTALVSTEDGSIGFIPLDCVDPI